MYFNVLTKLSLWVVIGLYFFTGEVYSHDPVFSPGPHVLFKNGFEVHLEFDQDKQGSESKNRDSLAVKYGLSGDWVVGIELPYLRKKDLFVNESGIGDLSLLTKYRFWRNDQLGIQESAAVLVKVKLDSSNNKTGSGTTDSLLGISYGYESLTWYRWASVRYRFNQNKTLQNIGSLQRADKLFVDLAGGYRPQVNDYRAADTVLMLELNGEFSARSALNNIGIGDTGGNQWFISPGVMWTLRNFAIKGGIQIPLLADLNDSQSNANYRVRLEFEWHL